MVSSGSGRGGGADRFCKPSQGLRIDRVRFGQLAGGFGKITDLPGVDHGDGNPGNGQRARQWHFQATRGLQDETRGLTVARSRSTSVVMLSSVWGSTARSPDGRSAISN